MMGQLTFFDFCSGIGGGRIGFEKNGYKCVGHSDTSRLADKTYQLINNCSDINYGNLKKLTKETLPDFDVLVAGFPCQTFSVIGRKSGFIDKRGQVIFQLSRIINETRPKCFLLENVKGLTTHDKGQTFKVVINELSKCGYNVIHKVLDSLDYGVPQMRKRVYIIGFRNDLTINCENFQWPQPVPHPDILNFLIEKKVVSHIGLEVLEHYLNNSTNQGKISISELRKMDTVIIDTRMNDVRVYNSKCPTLRAHRDGLLYTWKGEICQLTGYEALLLQGFPIENANKVKDLVSDRHLLMQAGNAMTVNVIQDLGASIKNMLFESKID